MSLFWDAEGFVDFLQSRFADLLCAVDYITSEICSVSKNLFIDQFVNLVGQIESEIHTLKTLNMVTQRQTESYEGSSILRIT